MHDFAYLVSCCSFFYLTPLASFCFGLRIPDQNLKEVFVLATINLKKVYPEYYSTDNYCEVPEVIASTLLQSDRRNHADNERRRVHKAYYSLDALPEEEKRFLVESCEDVFESVQTVRAIREAIDRLPLKQAERLYAHYFLGLSKAEIARREGVKRGTVKNSIDQALKVLREFLKNFA